MQGANFLSPRLRMAMQYRGLEPADVAEMTGIATNAVQQVVDGESTCFSNEDIATTARSLFIPPAWLLTQKAIPPAWPRFQAIPLPPVLESGAPGPVAEPADDDDRAVYEAWIAKLGRAWLEYLNLKRDAVQAESVDEMIIQTRFSRAETYHRSIVLQPITEAFTPEGLIALSKALLIPVPDRLTSTDIAKVLAEQQTVSETMRRARVETIVGQLDDDQWTSYQLLISQTTTRDACPVWPLVTSDPGRSYGLMISPLGKELQRVAKGLGSAKPTGRPPKQSKAKEPKGTLWNVTAYQDALWFVFRSRFPDDYKGPLKAAVKAYRDFLKVVTVEVGRARLPDYGRSPYDVCNQIPPGRIVRWEYLVELGGLVGVSHRRLAAFFDPQASPPDQPNQALGQGTADKVLLDTVRPGDPRILFRLWKRGKSCWVLCPGPGD